MTTGVQPGSGAGTRRFRRPVGDRRRRERRRHHVPVALERRKGVDRRTASSASSPLSNSQVFFDRQGFSDPENAVRLAAVSAAEIWRNEKGEAVDFREVEELLGLIVQAVERADAGSSVDPRLDSVLGRHLLEMIRGELVRSWQLNESETPSTPEILAILGRFETVRASIEPDWSLYFASRLSGPDGLDLVVEVAHDLRSPLTSILFLAETLQRGQSGGINSLQSRQLGLIYSAALGLSEMASNVIELARNGDRLVSDHLTPFSIADVLEATCDITRPIAVEKGLTMKLVTPATDHRLGLPLALSRVLLNLTTNALHFTQGGFVELAARETGPLQVEFSVRDTGPGISNEAFETLCSPFRRRCERDGYQFSGTGVGLALCRRLVEAMGSELRCESRQHWGTRFHFTVDLEHTLH